MGNSASALPFAIGDLQFVTEDGWSVHKGSKKSDGSEVTVFQASKPKLAKQCFRGAHSNFQIFPAHHHYKYCKKMRHPAILQVLASLDTDNPNADVILDQNPLNMPTSGEWIIVTESCIPLHQWLDTNPSPNQLAWGLQCMISSLSFLHNSANLSHGNLSLGTWYVTKGGDVKLWNFSLVTPVGVVDGGGGPTPYFREYEAILTPQTYRSPERIQKKWDGIATSGVHTMDSYGMGILMNEYYKGKIPGPLQKAVQRLQTQSLKMRPRLAPLLKCPVFETPYAKFMAELDEIAVQPVEHKLRFWQSLQMEKIDTKVAQYKLLPIIQNSISAICSSESLLSQDFYRREVSAMLAPLFYIVEFVLEEGTIGKELTPLCPLLFAVKDRGVRGALLSRTNLLSSNLSKQDINASVFEPLCSGFSDSSEALRELTLKATLVLVPHLYPTNVEKLSRYLVRMQSDNSANIRTNTLAVIPQLSPHLSEMARQKLLLPAFVRAFKDPHGPCRLAALKATALSKEWFTLTDIAVRVLPSIMPMCLDELGDVRGAAFTVIDEFMVSLKRNHQETSVGEIPSQTIQPAMQMQSVIPVTTPSASGSYLSGLSSWMSTSTKPDDKNGGEVLGGQPSNGASLATRSSLHPSSSGQLLNTTLIQSVPAFSSLSITGSSTHAAPANDGWDDDDDDDLDLGGAKDDDVFAALDLKPSRPSKIITSKTSTQQRAALKTNIQKTEVKKLEVGNDDMADGWDDF